MKSQRWASKTRPLIPWYILREVIQKYFSFWIDIYKSSKLSIIFVTFHVKNRECTWCKNQKSKTQPSLCTRASSHFRISEKLQVTRCSKLLISWNIQLFLQKAPPGIEPAISQVIDMLELRPSGQNIDLEHFEHWNFRSISSTIFDFEFSIRAISSGEMVEHFEHKKISSNHRAISSINLEKIFEQNRAFFERNQTFFEHDRAESTVTPTSIKFFK